jgi:GNAT superfamily N-acetyltransferase
MAVDLRLALATDIEVLESLVTAYHDFENIQLLRSPDACAQAIMPLLEFEHLGRIWLIHADGEIVGYIALCFGYSIEFSGRDAFIDEFFIRQPYRGKGIGRAALEQVAAHALKFNIAALHLEVAKSNTRAAKLYASAAFKPRAKYQLITLALASN